jgi:hypothetical protein
MMAGFLRRRYASQREKKENDEWRKCHKAAVYS